MNEMLDGLLVLDKPGGLTSRDAVDRALRWFPKRTRIGHTGTLDPLATGVLVLCLGSATRLTEYVQRMGKTYRSVFCLGTISDTDDADGELTGVPDAIPPELDTVEAALKALVGTIQQVPPAHSAAKVSGRRAYDLARRGETVDLQPRPVQVYGIDVLRYEYPLLEVEVRCGKGTYIRSLARDLGLTLGCGSHVQVLRRTRVGPFTPDLAVPLDAPRDEAMARVLPVRMAVSDLPHCVVSPSQIDRLRSGQGIELPADVPEGEVAAFSEAGRLVAICQVIVDRRVLRPAKVLG